MFGVDFGTSYTKTAYVDASGKPFAIPNGRGTLSTPTAVCLMPSGPPLIGTDAREQGYVYRDCYVANFKLKLGSNDNLLRNGLVLTATDAAAVVLKAMKTDAESRLGHEVTYCVLTCPANFRDDAKQALREACKKAGLDDLLLLPEPTAAGLAYAVDKLGDLTYLVYDFGGGTFDVAVQQVKGEEITTLATEGVAKLGGNDFNEKLKERVLAEFQKKGGIIPYDEDEPLFQLELDRRVEDAKLSLARQPEVPIVVTHGSGQVIVKVTQQQFEQDVEPLIRQSLEAMDRAVANAGLKMTDIGRIVLLGGTSKSPIVQKMVAEHTGITPKLDVDPEKAVSYGAAIMCAIKMKEEGKNPDGRIIPTPNVFIRDVTAHGVGCCVIDTAGGQKRLVHSVIIPKNTPIPCKRVDTFFLEHEDQREAKVEILQGEADAERDDCLVIGEIVLDNLPPEPKRTSRIQVQYVIDSNGMVTTTATDKVGKQQKSVTVDYKHGVKTK